MPKKIILLFLIFSLPVFSQEKQLAAVAVDTFECRADIYVGSDGFGFHYFITNDVFIKTDGRISLEFRKNATGKIARADIENPLLIVLFYENFNTVVLLDNQLNEVREINFSSLNTNNNEQVNQNPIVAHTAGMASQNRLWIYDSMTQKLGLYDYLKNSWQPITTPVKESIAWYQTDFNTFQWADVKSDWYASDVFGKILMLGKLPDYDRIRFVSETAFLYSKGGKLYLKELKDNTVYMVATIDNSFKNFYYKDQILSIFTNRGITNYKIILP